MHDDPSCSTSDEQAPLADASTVAQARSVGVPLRRALAALAAGAAIDWWGATREHLWIGLAGLVLCIYGLLFLTEALALVSDRLRAPFRERFERAYARNEREAAEREARYAREAAERAARGEPRE